MQDVALRTQRQVIQYPAAAIGAAFRADGKRAWWCGLLRESTDLDAGGIGKLVPQDPRDKPARASC